MDFDLNAAVGGEEVKKSEGKQVEGIFGFGKKDKDKSKDKSDSKDKDKHKEHKDKHKDKGEHKDKDKKKKKDKEHKKKDGHKSSSSSSDSVIFNKLSTLYPRHMCHTTLCCRLGSMHREGQSLGVTYFPFISIDCVGEPSGRTADRHNDHRHQGWARKTG